MKTISISESAQKEIDNMFSTCNWIGSYYGFKSDQYVSASQSLMVSYHKMFALGGTINRDSELNLICHNEWITYGVNFHRDTTFHGFEIVKYGEDGKPNIVTLWPGTWSVNS
jgi:hypothetical protein